MRDVAEGLHDRSDPLIDRRWQWVQRPHRIANDRRHISDDAWTLGESFEQIQLISDGLKSYKAATASGEHLTE